MRRTAGCLVLTVLLFAGIPLPAQGQQAREAILHILVDQQAAWNRGDIAAFMRGYDNSPTTTFIGKSVEQGYQKILERYRRNYGSRAAMGELAFYDLNVRMLGAEHAVVTGHFRLTRTQAGGGEATGVFSLVFEEKSGGWKIILDHTSS